MEYLVASQLFSLFNLTREKTSPYPAIFVHNLRAETPFLQFASAIFYPKITIALVPIRLRCRDSLERFLLLYMRLQKNEIILNKPYSPGEFDDEIAQELFSAADPCVAAYRKLEPGPGSDF
ncbi:hypothetical protein ACFL4X_01535 [Gemmatimonadota bacterium]